MTTAEILKQLRTNKNLRQADIAQMLGISQPAYQKYELGNAEPNGANYIKLADFYDVTTDYLLGREPQKDPFADLDLCAEDEQAVIDKYMSFPPEIRATLKGVYQQTFDDRRRQVDATIDDYFAQIYATKYDTANSKQRKQSG